MTVFVIDASFAGSLFLPDETSESAMALVASARTGKHSLVTNHLWWYEMTNLFISAVRRKRLTREQLPEIWRLIEALPIETHQAAPGWPDTAELALDSGLTSYDASYLALAQRLKAGLATHDIALQKAAKKMQIPLWEPHE